MDTRHALLGFVLALLCVSLLSAQSTKVEVFGVVRDPADLPVAGADIHIRNIDTLVTADTKSDPSGVYRFVALPPGNYEISVKKDGFSLLRRTGLTFRVGEQVPLDLALKVGDISQSVEVEEAAPLLQSTRGTVSFTATKEQIETLPLDGRNFIPLIALSPGVMLPPTSTFPRIITKRPVIIFFGVREA